jgi:5-methyltetrahydropteroyltriglutamate--homocysteine methyltransferase
MTHRIRAQRSAISAFTRVFDALWRCAAEPGPGFLTNQETGVPDQRCTASGTRKGIPMKRTKPPFRADHVGSLLRPAALKKAREQRVKGEIDAAALKAVEDCEIERVIGKQEDAGLQSITDGEFRRSWWHLDFLWGLDGVEKHVMDTGVAFAAVTTRNEGVKVTGKVGFSGHPMIEHFKFVAAHTKRTPKITIPAPSAIYGRPMRLPIDQKIYPKLDAFFDDLGQAYKKSVRAFADAGCRYLQLDEVFIAMLCDEKYRAQMKARGDDPEMLGPLYGDLINTAMSDIPSDMTITMHLCRGNYKSTFMGSGGYEAEQEILFNRIKVHGYFMEYDSDRAGGFEPLKLVPKDRQVVLGLVTTKTGRLESKDDLKRRIEEAAKYISLNQLCLSPQCGFASTEEGNTLAEDEQWAKLRMIVEVAKEVWG